MTRWRWMSAMAVAMLLALIGGSARAAEPKPDSMLVCLGTYTGPKSKGIYVTRLNLADGMLAKPELAAELASPSFLAIHPTGKFLYAISEVNAFGEKKTGAVSAFSIDPASGKLTLLNQQSSGGPGPCYIALDSAGDAALVANYGGGSVESLPIGGDGKLKDPATFIQHEGHSVNAQRQKEPHAHSINLDPQNKFAFAADLGLDKILIYRFDRASGKSTAHDPAFASVAPGSGPRHFDFHPSGQFAYVINEIASTVTAFSYNPAKGALTQIHTLTTLPAEFKGNSSTADIHVHPSGKFVYGSNRGHDSIASFSIDEQTGKLTPTGHTPTQGKTPRNFGIDPTGQYLLAANQQSDSVVVFRIDEKTGAPTPTGSTIEVGAPVCVKFIAMK